MNDTNYQLRIVSSARRHLTEDLPEAVATAAFEFITGPLLENPHRVGKQLRPPLADRHSARRGTYRVLYRIDEETRTVTVLAIGHLPRVINPEPSGRRRTTQVATYGLRIARRSHNSLKKPSEGALCAGQGTRGGTSGESL